MAKFRKKPVAIEAVRFNPEAKPWYEIEFPDGVRRTNYQEVSLLLETSGCSKEHPYWSWDRMGYVITPEGGCVISPGDWIIKGVKGEFYPCKPDIFEATHEPI